MLKNHFVSDTSNWLIFFFSLFHLFPFSQAGTGGGGVVVTQPSQPSSPGINIEEVVWQTCTDFLQLYVKPCNRRKLTLAFKAHDLFNIAIGHKPELLRPTSWLNCGLIPTIKVLTEITSNFILYAMKHF